MNYHSLDLYDISTGDFDTDTFDDIVHKKALPVISVVESLVGSYSVSIGDSPTYETVECGFFIAPSQKLQTITHHSNKQTGRMKARWVFFGARVNNAYALEMLYDFPIVCSDEINRQLHGILDRIFKTDDFFERCTAVSEIVKILVKIGTPKKVVNEDILLVTEYINKNYQSKITASELTKTVNVSYPKLYKDFIKEFGIPPIEYVNQRRLGKAQLLLENSQMSIKEIALYCGFTDPLYFSRYFKKHIGFSPSEYRIKT